MSLSSRYIEMAEDWQQVDGLSTARSYASDVKQSFEDQIWPASSLITGVAAEGRQTLEVEEAHQEVLALDPPRWLPDSYASACGGCHLQFIPLRRLKHHCRCGERVWTAYDDSKLRIDVNDIHL